MTYLIQFYPNGKEPWDIAQGHSCWTVSELLFEVDRYIETQGDYVLQCELHFYWPFSKTHFVYLSVVRMATLARMLSSEDRAFPPATSESSASNYPLPPVAAAYLDWSSSAIEVSTSPQRVPSPDHATPSALPSVCHSTHYTPTRSQPNNDSVADSAMNELAELNTILSPESSTPIPWSHSSGPKPDSAMAEQARAYLDLALDLILGLSDESPIEVMDPNIDWSLSLNNLIPTVDVPAAEKATSYSTAVLDSTDGTENPDNTLYFLGSYDFTQRLPMGESFESLHYAELAMDLGSPDEPNYCDSPPSGLTPGASWSSSLGSYDSNRSLPVTPSAQGQIYPDTADTSQNANFLEDTTNIPISSFSSPLFPPSSSPSPRLTGLSRNILFPNHFAKNLVLPQVSNCTATNTAQTIPAKREKTVNDENNNDVDPNPITKKKRREDEFIPFDPLFDSVFEEGESTGS